MTRFKVFNSEIKSIDEKEETLTALVSTDAVDRMGEVLDPGGANLKNFKKNPVVMFGHKYDEPPIGTAQWIKKSAEGVIAKIKFAPTAFAKEIFELYKGGFMRAFSVGFIPNMDKIEEGDGKKKPRLKFLDWELLEFSAVPVPANPEALALAMKRGILKNEGLKKEMSSAIEKDEDGDVRSHISLLVRAAEEFDETRTLNINDSIKAVLGKLKDGDEICLQSLLFDKNEWDLEKAFKTDIWIEELKSIGLDIKIEDLTLDTTKAPKKVEAGLDDAMAEIKELKDKNVEQEKHINNLKYQVLLANKKPSEKTLSEMTVGEVRKIIEEEASGVIRKAQGKVD